MTDHYGGSCLINLCTFSPSTKQEHLFQLNFKSPNFSHYSLRQTGVGYAEIMVLWFSCRRLLHSAPHRCPGGWAPHDQGGLGLSASQGYCFWFCLRHQEYASGARSFMSLKVRAEFRFFTRKSIFSSAEHHLQVLHRY